MGEPLLLLFALFPQVGTERNHSVALLNKIESFVPTSAVRVVSLVPVKVTERFLQVFAMLLP